MSENLRLAVAWCNAYSQLAKYLTSTLEPWQSADDRQLPVDWPRTAEWLAILLGERTAMVLELHRMGWSTGEGVANAVAHAASACREAVRRYEMTRYEPDLSACLAALNPGLELADFVMQKALADDNPIPPPPSMPSQSPAAETTAHLALCSGGFTYRGIVNDLTGRSFQMLRALLESPLRRCTRDELRIALEIDDEAVDFPDQIVLDAATKLRKALRLAADEAGQRCNDPLPSTGRGSQLAYALAMP